MTDTYRGVPYPTSWANMDYYRQRAWKMGVLSAVGHLGLEEAQRLAAELELTNGTHVTVNAEERAAAKLNVYETLRRMRIGALDLGADGKLSQRATMRIADAVAAFLISAGWGDLSGAKIAVTQSQMESQDAIRECNEALRRATGGE